MKIILTGTGTSHGVPVIGCRCKVCTSKDPRDNRNRSAAYVESPSKIIIDTGPEFRIQAIKYGISAADAVLITHSHADHMNGLDDLRIFSHTKSVDPGMKKNTNETEGEGLPIYANSGTLHDIRNRFDYIFKPVTEGGGKPKLHLIDSARFTSKNPLFIGEVRVIPVPILHGSLDDNGWLLSEKNPDTGWKSIAYLTDCSCIPQSSIDLIHENAGNLVHLVIDGLRPEPHSTHFSFDQALEAAEKISAKHTWLIHMTHLLLHTEVQKYINDHIENFPGLKKIIAQGGTVQPSYDGLKLEI